MHPKPLAATDIALVGPEPAYTPYGYIIQEDGTVLSLLNPYYHGVACAILYPDIAKGVGVAAPDDSDPPDVFFYQAFESDEHYRMPVLRVAIGQLIGSIHVSKGYAPATKQQLEALRKVFKVLGYNGRSKVFTEFGDFNVAHCLESMTEDEHWRDEFRLSGLKEDGSRVAQKLRDRKAWGLD